MIKAFAGALFLTMGLITVKSKGQIKIITNNTQKTHYLEIAYDKAFVHKHSDSINYQKQFFKNFPSTFEDLCTIYGYDDKKGAAPLYNVAKLHIDKLFNLACVDSEKKATKFVGISLNGKWDADAVGYFQNNLQTFTIDKFATIIRLLNTYTDSDTISFWKFYLDIEDTDYRKKSYDSIVGKLRANNSKMTALVTEAYQIINKQQQNH
ncbi:hypothetical protein [Mucilaginibacter agri]|uniref:Uncharacterized protein n=1 Tax=Mucilaginibacter agri TaxID=2695265 RepID=A0A965ZFH3_9SPHI|nr:hypothetical protein [Mucilaginibacter agri]NCD70083.1 hypothetical protein [Mucilaginibacter agri]